MLCLSVSMVQVLNCSCVMEGGHVASLTLHLAVLSLLLFLLILLLLSKNMFKLTLRQHARALYKNWVLYKNMHVDSAWKRLIKTRFEQFCFKPAPERRQWWNSSYSEEGRAFQARAAATGNAQLPSVVLQVDQSFRCNRPQMTTCRRVGIFV